MACGGAHTLALTASGALYSWGDGSSGQLGHGDAPAERTEPRVVKLDETISAIAAGARHSAATTVRGQCFCWGDGGDGRLGLPDDSWGALRAGDGDGDGDSAGAPAGGWRMWMTSDWCL